MLGTDTYNHLANLVIHDAGRVMNWHLAQVLEMQSLEIRDDASLASIGHPFSLNWHRLIEDRISSSARMTLQARDATISTGLTEHYQTMCSKRRLSKFRRTHAIAN